MNEIYLDGADRNICCDCVAKLRIGGKPEKLKKSEHGTVHRTEKSEEDEE